MPNGEVHNLGDYPSRLEEANNAYWDKLQQPRVYPGKPPVIEKPPAPEISPELRNLAKMYETFVIPALCACMCDAMQRLMMDSMLLVKNPMWEEPPIRSAATNGAIDRFARGIVLPPGGPETIVVTVGPIPDRHVGVIRFVGQLLSAAAAFGSVGWFLRRNSVIVPGYGDQGPTGFFFQLGDPTNVPSGRLPVPIILSPRSTFTLSAFNTGAVAVSADARLGGWFYETNITSDIITALGGGHGKAGGCAPPSYSTRVVR